MELKFTTESVCRGHPDKVADQIAEYLLDFLVSKDPDARCGIEVMVMGHMIIIGGEINSKVALPNVDCNWKHIIWLIKDIGYCENTWPGLDNLIIRFEINEQSAELKKLSKKGAGDNCSVFGMATDSEVSDYMPLGHQFASIYMRTLGEPEYRTCSGPDGKIQVIDTPKRLESVTLCLQKPGKIGSTLVTDIMHHASNVNGIKENEMPTRDCRLFDKGGPRADTGLTGRKLMVDTYGTYCPHGGGAFAGKDVSKPDKTLALFARYIAKNLVKSGFANTIILQISTTIGREGNFDFDYEFADFNPYDCDIWAIEKVLDYFSKYTMADVIKLLKLREVKFSKFAYGGYFGRKEEDAYWEHLPFPKKFFGTSMKEQQAFQPKE